MLKIEKTNKGYKATKTILRLVKFVSTATFIAESEEKVKEIIEKDSPFYDDRGAVGTVVKEEITINIEEDYA